MSELNYDDDINIDQSALDVEWLRQPKLILKYSQHETECRRDYDKAKADLEIVEAELDKEIRNKPEKFGLDKITETAIKKAIQTSEHYQGAEEKVAEAQYEWNMAQAAVRSIYAKKDALENLVRLFGQQYFAGPKMPRDIDDEWEKRATQKQSNKKVKFTRNK